MLRAGKLWMIVVVRRSYRELYMQRADPISLPPFDREANQNTRECSEANQTRVKATSLLSDPFILFHSVSSVLLHILLPTPQKANSAKSNHESGV